MREQVGISPLLKLLQTEDEELIIACVVTLEVALQAFGGWDAKKPSAKSDPKMLLGWTFVLLNKLVRHNSLPFFSTENETDIDFVMIALTEIIDSTLLSAGARESIIDVIVKNLPRIGQKALGWTRKFITNNGIERLLTVAIVRPDDHLANPSAMNISKSTRKHVSLALFKVYDDLMSDKERTMYRERCEAFVEIRLRDPTIETKLHAALAITTLLQGAFDVGNAFLGREGILQMLLTMASTDDPRQQLVAVDAIVSSATKKDKCAAILNDGVPVLKRLYKSPHDHVKVRALVGLCRVAAHHGTDASRKAMPEESLLKLSQTCRKYLVDRRRDADLRYWAVEGLSYLSLDADVKEALVTDEDAIRAFIELSNVADVHDEVVYAVTSVFVHITNSYDKEDAIPELVELARFAKHHVPEDHIKDGQAFLDARIRALSQAGVSGALSCLERKTESESVRELISRVFLALTESVEHRGLAVQQGASKALISLALDGSEKGRDCAAQALARLGITSDPKTVFPGQRAYEVVRPLTRLLAVDKTGLQNYEALMCLTNLASMSDSVRKRFVDEHCVMDVENYMFERHEQLRCAATECIVNLLLNQQVFDSWVVPETDRIKLLVLLANEEEDERLNMAASGALCLLSRDRVACEKIARVGVWLEMLQHLLSSGAAELRYRGAFIVRNLASAQTDLAQCIVESELFDVLNATMQMVNAPGNERVIELVLEVLDIFKEKQLAAPNREANGGGASSALVASAPWTWCNRSSAVIEEVNESAQ